MSTEHRVYELERVYQQSIYMSIIIYDLCNGADMIT